VTTPQSPRSAVLLALILGVGGVGLVVSGILMLGSGSDGTAATTSLPAPATTTTSGQPGTTTGTTEVPTTTVPVTAVRAFVTLTDDSGMITFAAPADWTDVSTSEWTRDGKGIGPSIGAAVDIPAWVEGWGTPGLFVGVTDRIGPEEAHGDFSGACLHDRSEPTSAGGHTGTGDWWWLCGDQGTSFYVAVLDLGQGRIALFQILDSPEALPGVVERVLATFQYQG
jgi:hypothetical protein